MTGQSNALFAACSLECMGCREAVEIRLNSNTRLAKPISKRKNPTFLPFLKNSETTKRPKKTFLTFQPN